MELLAAPQWLAFLGAALLVTISPGPDNLLIVLQTARVIQGSYGATRFGPYDAPPPAMLASFAQGCRAAGVSR